MSEPALDFLRSMARYLSAARLYRSDHPSREAPLDDAAGAVRELLADRRRTSFSFLAGEVVHDDEPLDAMQEWPWAGRLADAGVQRVDLERGVDRGELAAFLDRVADRVEGPAPDAAPGGEGATEGEGPTDGEGATDGQDEDARDLGRGEGHPDHPHVRFGDLGLREGEGGAGGEDAAARIGRLSLEEEAETVAWLHERAAEEGWLPMAEAVAVVRSLAVGMHAARRLVVPFRRLRDADDYTAAHCVNVSILSMRLAEEMGEPSSRVLDVGRAGLLHDVGKVRSGGAGPAAEGDGAPGERIGGERDSGERSDRKRPDRERHPVEGCRILLEGEDGALAADVALEHHRRPDGGGYPERTYDRDLLPETRIVQVCDLYDALRLPRSGRTPPSADRAAAVLRERSGDGLDGACVEAFLAMIDRWDPAEHLVEAEPGAEEGDRPESGAASRQEEETAPRDEDGTGEGSAEGEPASSRSPGAPEVPPEFRTR